MSKVFKRILLTGAAGNLGTMLRDRIKPWCEVVRLSDIGALGQAREGEELHPCDLSDKAGVLALLKDVDVVLHFGGISTESNFEAIMKANIQGTYNLYEAAHKHGIRRIVFASSNHAIGFHKVTELLDADSPTRPDSMYGLSKVFGEQLARYYFDRAGIETVCLRIGSAWPTPKNRRMLSTWMSADDLVEALRCSLFAQRVGHAVLYGVSDNPGIWWSNAKAAHLGFHPKDSSRQFDGMFSFNGEYPPADDPATLYQGGSFVNDGPQYV